MYRSIELRKEHDWSLSLEDAHYVEHQADIWADSLKAIAQTAEGRYVNIVTPGELGPPQEWLIPELERLAKAEKLRVRAFAYVGECGCGGHVSRVYV